MHHQGEWGLSLFYTPWCNIHPLHALKYYSKSYFRSYWKCLFPSQLVWSQSLSITYTCNHKLMGLNPSTWLAYNHICLYLFQYVSGYIWVNMVLPYNVIAVWMFTCLTGYCPLPVHGNRDLLQIVLCVTACFVGNVWPRHLHKDGTLVECGLKVNFNHLSYYFILHSLIQITHEVLHVNQYHICLYRHGRSHFEKSPPKSIRSVTSF